MEHKYHDAFEIGCYYHIYNRSINKELLFVTDRNYRFFLSRWAKYFDNHLDVLAYCLLPNHFHFFVQVCESESMGINEILENRFKRFFSSYSLAFNREHNRTGSLLQKRFKRIKVSDEDYFTTLIHYIHNNPIHHKITTNYIDWKYNSYNAIISDGSSKVNREKTLNWFGGREAFIAYHKQNINYQKLSDIRSDSL